MFSIIGILFCGFIVGVLSGITGMGGVLIPPFLIVFLGMDSHVAMGTSMASFLLPCVIGIYTHYRLGNIDWSLTLPLCSSGMVCVLAGTELMAYLPGSMLNILLAALVLFVGGLAFRPVSRVGSPAQTSDQSFFSRDAVKLSLLGGGVGVLSGMTGTGGPVLSVPAMLAMGYAPLASIAAGMVYTFPVSIAGTIGNIVNDSVDLRLAALCALGQIAGIKVGFAVARFFNAHALKKFVASVCLLTGLFILARTFLL